MLGKIIDKIKRIWNLPSDVLLEEDNCYVTRDGYRSKLTVQELIDKHREEFLPEGEDDE